MVTIMHLTLFQPARITAHHTPSVQYPNKVTILIKLEKSVLDREELMK